MVVIENDIYLYYRDKIALHRARENIPRRFCTVFGVGLGRRLGLSGVVRRIGQWLSAGSIDGGTRIR